MALLLRCGAVFLHVPKTGGTWVRETLRESGLVRCRFSHKHADLHRAVRSPDYYRRQHWKRCLRFGPRWHDPVRDAFKFCFVRHPLTWYESWWKFMSMLNWPRFAKLQRNGRRAWHPTADLEDQANQRFNDFMSSVLQHQPGFVTRLYTSYTLPEIDYVGRQENLVDDLIEVLRILGENFDEDRIRHSLPVNTSHVPTHRRVTWTDDLRDRCLQFEQAALQRYGYESDETCLSA